MQTSESAPWLQRMGCRHAAARAPEEEPGSDADLMAAHSRVEAAFETMAKEWELMSARLEALAATKPALTVPRTVPPPGTPYEKHIRNTTCNV